MDIQASLFYGKICCDGKLFCVVNGIFALTAKGLYAGDLINKRRYFPKNVPGYLINRHFDDKEVEYVDMLKSIISLSIFGFLNL